MPSHMGSIANWYLWYNLRCRRAETRKVFFWCCLIRELLASSDSQEMSKPTTTGIHFRSAAQKAEPFWRVVSDVARIAIGRHKFLIYCRKERQVVWERNRLSFDVAGFKYALGNTYVYNTIISFSEEHCLPIEVEVRIDNNELSMRVEVAYVF